MLAFAPRPLKLLRNYLVAEASREIRSVPNRDPEAAEKFSDSNKKTRPKNARDRVKFFCINIGQMPKLLQMA